MCVCVCSLRLSFTLNPFYWFNVSQKKTETAFNTSAGSKGVGRERDIHPPTHLSSKRVAAGRLADSGASERGGTRLPPLPLLSGELRRYLNYDVPPFLFYQIRTSLNVIPLDQNLFSPVV